MFFDLRFNRYMVECEWQRSQPVRPGIQGFNRYMVECEYTISEVIRIELTSVLIDTWWNVNEDIEVKKKSDIEF